MGECYCSECNTAADYDPEEEMEAKIKSQAKRIENQLDALDAVKTANAELKEENATLRAQLEAEEIGTEQLAEVRRENVTLRATAELVEKLRPALRELLDDYDLAGFIYEVRGGLELPADFEGSTWDHPKVVRFGDIVATLREALGEAG